MAQKTTCVKECVRSIRSPVRLKSSSLGSDFYEAMPEKNGEVWAGVLCGHQMVRPDPRTEKWTVYELPEYFAYDPYNWIDSSTHPVTAWYVDYDGHLLRIQPLE